MKRFFSALAACLVIACGAHAQQISPAGGGGAGTVTTTGTPTTGSLTKFSGPSSVGSGDLTGDTVTSGSLVSTTLKVDGVSYPVSPSISTVPVVTGSNTVTYETLPIAAGGTGAVALASYFANVSGTLGITQLVNVQTGTTYSIATTDANQIVMFTNSGAVAISLSATSVTGFSGGFSFYAQNAGGATDTITPTVGTTINGQSSFALPPNSGCQITSNAGNYFVSYCTANLPVATSASFGAVQTDGSTIVNSSGIISCATGSASQLGCLKPDATTITASAGSISANFPSPGAIGGTTPGSGSFTSVKASAQSQSGISTPTISTSTFAINAALGNDFTIDLSHAACPCTISTPTNAPAAGYTQRIVLHIVQSSSGTDVVGTWGTAFDFGSASAPTLSTGANKEDLVAFNWDPTLSKWLYMGFLGGF